MRHRNTINSTEDTTLVFDKGNVSESAIETMLLAGQHFVCAVPRNTPTGSNLYAAPLEQFKDVLGVPGTRAFCRDVMLWNKSLKAVLTYSEGYFASQLTELTDRMQKCQKKLHDLDIANSKSNRKTAKSLLEAAEAVLSGDYMKEIFEIDTYKKEGKWRLRYKVNQDHLAYLTQHVLGRNLLITTRFEWKESEIISAYRGQSNIEESFKRIKDQEYLHWQPAFHWTDQKVKVHGLYCVLALLVTSLIQKTVVENNIDMSLFQTLTELSKIKEVALFDSSKKDKRQKGALALSRMSAKQKKLAEATEINLILSR
jgi:transposase